MEEAFSALGRDKTHKIFLVGNSEGKKQLERTRRRWEDSIRMDLRGIGLQGMDWIHLAQDRELSRILVNTVMNLHVPQKKGNFLPS
jgi:hypothetical protein